MIGSFQKLFPHSKNLLLTLRNVEDNLRLHFERGVDEKSRLEENQRVSETDLAFRVISESEKARKYKDLFNISLESFHQRGLTMLSRLRKELECPVGEMLFYRVVRTKEEVYDIINSSFHRTASWHELPHGL